MIEGIEIELTYEDLYNRLRRRAKYHDDERQRQEGLAATVPPTNVYDKIYYDERKLEAARHKKHAQFYHEAAERLVVGETFRLKIEQFKEIFIADTEEKP